MATGKDRARDLRGAPEKRAWQRMLSGRRLDLLDPSPIDVEIIDIAHGLARVARWNGQTQGPHAYSVAQHSLLVEQLLLDYLPAATPADRLGALLHDAPEYVIGDMISPFKAVLGDSYRLVEARIEAAVRLRFGLTPHPSAALKKHIKSADRASAYFEATRLAGFTSEESLVLFGRPPADVEPDMSPLSPVAAQAAFLARFEALMALCDAEAGREEKR